MFETIFYKIIIIYLISINLTSLLSMKLDKERAKHHKWRISEKSLFLMALLGGSAGSILGMHIFRHKTKHLAFVIGMPVIMILQISLWIYLSFL